MKIIVSGILLLVVLAITAGALDVLVPIYGKPVGRYLLSKADEAYTDDHYGQAMIDLDEACALNPSNALIAARYLSGKADEAYTEGHYSRCLADMEKACQFDPNNALLLNNYAWTLATAPDADVRDGKKALTLALQACQLTSYQNAPDVDTLAAAYAETGDFDNAVKWETKYLSSLSLTPADATDGQARLALYQAKTPYHDQK